MPYITQDKREFLQPEIDALVNQLRFLGKEERAGNLNFVFTYIINEMYNVNKYREFNDAIGTLECCKLEFYRRRIGPYEDQACEKNGDVNYTHVPATVKKDG